MDRIIFSHVKSIKGRSTDEKGVQPRGSMLCSSAQKDVGASSRCVLCSSANDVADFRYVLCSGANDIRAA